MISNNNILMDIKWQGKIQIKIKYKYKNLIFHHDHKICFIFLRRWYFQINFHALKLSGSNFKQIIHNYTIIYNRTLV